MGMSMLIRGITATCSPIRCRETLIHAVIPMVANTVRIKLHNSVYYYSCNSSGKKGFLLDVNTTAIPCIMYTLYEVEKFRLHN